MKFVYTLGLAFIISFFSLHAEENSTMHQHPIIIMKTTQGDIEIELFPKVAPKAVENFLGHIEHKYYNGLTFHRIIPDFMIQGGDPKGDGTGGESIWKKSFSDEIDPKVRFDRPGILAMANSGPHTNGSQFFITTVETPWLNGKHTIFGYVIGGYETVKKIDSMGSHSGKPRKEQKIIEIIKK